MEEQAFQFNAMILTALLSPILLWYLYRIFSKTGSKAKVPPSPSKLPIIGNLHQLGRLPHQDLHSLAKTHGPLMLLHFGSVPVIVVSSAGLAREITRKHDVVFSNRPANKVFEKVTYGCKDMSVRPYGEHWRQVRSIAVLQLLSNKRVQSSRAIREEETALFVEKLRESRGEAVDLSEMFVSFTNDGIGRAAFGKKLSVSEHGKKFLAALEKAGELAGAINVGDYIPWLDWIGRLNGFYNRLDKAAEELDQVLEDMVQEREHKIQLGNGGEEDLFYILLEIYKTQSGGRTFIDRDTVKAVLLDIFVGGTDTISTAMEWAMTELLRNPAVMEKLQTQVRGIVKGREEIRDDDLEKMHNLKAVIKEALRIHPPFPLLAPRLCTEDVQFNGFNISAGTILMINAWAMGRDPVSWDEPEKFKPERFLNSSIDYRGQDFELIPFGFGRRGCPGISFAASTMEFMLANIVQKFDWKLPNGAQGKDLDTNEFPGATVHRANPLLAVASISHAC